MAWASEAWTAAGTARTMVAATDPPSGATTAVPLARGLARGVPSLLSLVDAFVELPVGSQLRIEKGLSAQYPKPRSEDEANNYKAREYTAKHNESARVEGGSRLMLAR